MRHTCFAKIAPFPPVPSGVLQIAVPSTKTAFLVLEVLQIAVPSTKTAFLVLGVLQIAVPSTKTAFCVFCGETWYGR